MREERSSITKREKPQTRRMTESSDEDLRRDLKRPGRRLQREIMSFRVRIGVCNVQLMRLKRFTFAAVLPALKPFLLFPLLDPLLQQSCRKRPGKNESEEIGRQS